jgi:hypothetical protein
MRICLARQLLCGHSAPRSLWPFFSKAPYPLLSPREISEAVQRVALWTRVNSHSSSANSGADQPWSGSLPAIAGWPGTIEVVQPGSFPAGSLRGRAAASDEQEETNQQDAHQSPSSRLPFLHDLTQPLWEGRLGWFLCGRLHEFGP